jgi:uncharacterized protein YbaR (Trm112 family)
MLDINTFKQKCRKKEVINTPQHEQKEIQFLLLLKEQEQFEDELYAPDTKFDWRALRHIKICPVCGEELKKEQINRYVTMGFVAHYESDVIYTSECGYTYAIRE